MNDDELKSDLNALAEMKQPVERTDGTSTKDWRDDDIKHTLDVLTPLFQSGGSHTQFARLGGFLIDAVPRVVEAYDAAIAEIEELRRQHDDLHRQLEAAKREVEEVRSHISVTMSREHQARREAQEAKREAHGLSEQLARESDWVRIYKQDLDDAVAELAAVRQREAVPVKVRFDVTAQQFADDVFPAWSGLHFVPDRCMNYLAAHAVIDAPAGVPSVEELAFLAWRAENDKGIADGRKWEHCEYHDEARGFAEVGATAIRDRVLAGVAAEKEQLVSALIEAKRQRDELACKLITKNPNEPVYGGWHFEDGYKIVPNCELSGNPGKLPEPTDAQVEALAAVLREAHAKAMNEDVMSYGLTIFCAYARAAFAHIGAGPVGECAECKKNKSERDVMYRDWDDCRNRMLKVRLALNEGSES